ncbi:MAG: MAPEG family protein [Thalassotalea sp.]|nr:MAPEG family protein [Thalassotalea sp.]
MYYKRIGYSIANRIDAEKLYSPAQVAKLLPDDVNAPSNNLKNLFEMPVLFYVTIIVAALHNDHSITSNLSAWSFVFFRYCHSSFHCFNGRVMSRFICYVLSSLALFVLMANVFFQVLSR